MFNLPIDPAILLSIVALIVVFYLYLHERKLKEHAQRQGQELFESIPEEVWHTLEQSMQKSTEMVDQAELEGVKIVAESKLARDDFEKDYQAKLSEVTTKTETLIESAKNEFLTFIKGLEEKSQEFETTYRKTSEDKINSLFQNLEQRLSDFLVKTETSTTSSIQLELSSTRHLIDTYKDQQLKLIDENIIAMLEQTLNIVLGKKLSLADQVELVSEALEKAKVEKFIV